MKLLSLFYQYFSSLIFTSNCPSCNCRVTEPHTLCHSCWNKIIFITGNTCKSCGRPNLLNFAYENYCDIHCFKHRDFFKTIEVSCIYDDVIAKILHQFKYENKTRYIKVLEKLINTSHLYYIDVIIPVPLHKIRLRERGYNQSALIAKSAAKILNKPCAFDVLYRARHTQKQVSLERNARLRNITDAFAVNIAKQNTLNNKHILLVDDVITTGATVRECTKELKRHGAKSVSVIAIART